MKKDGLKLKQYESYVQKKIWKCIPMQEWWSAHPIVKSLFAVMYFLKIVVKYVYSHLGNKCCTINKHFRYYDHTEKKLFWFDVLLVTLG